MRRADAGGPTQLALVDPFRHGWRVTTAARAFVLALGTGSVLAAPGAVRAAPTVLALVLLAAASSGADLAARRRSASPVAAVVPALEGMVAAVLLVVAGAVGEPLLVYLTIPALVAGMRFGARAALVVSATSWLTCAGGDAVSEALGHHGLQPGAALTWLALGLGLGSFGAVHGRSTRQLAEARAPYLAAHRLVGQLHGLVERDELHVEVAALCEDLQASARRSTGAPSSAIWIRSRLGDVELLAAVGDTARTARALAARCAASGDAVVTGEGAALPLRLGDHVLGAVVLTGRQDWSPWAIEETQDDVDRRTLPLETALLIDGLRLSATLDERRRLARDLHDGVAQRVVALGLLVDELTATMADPSAVEVAEELRVEVSGVVDDLRLSMHDLRSGLRNGLAPSEGVSAGIADVVRELRRDSDLLVHLALEERGRPAARVEAELVRIAQEAIGNAHRHARARNLWVQLRADGEQLRLVVEDDGVGAATPRPGHYGLLTMRERAGLIGADLDITDRPDGGTRVTLETREDHRRDRDRLARR